MITLLSFGHKFGVPAADRTADCRSLRNPHHDPKLKPLTGRDKAIRDFVAADAKTAVLVDRILSVATDGETIAFGCYGGRHRSVAVVEMVGKALKDRGYEVEVHHRELREKRQL